MCPILKKKKKLRIKFKIFVLQYLFLFYESQYLKKGSRWVETFSWFILILNNFPKKQ